jgi:ABC-type glycerol-3-phosphate transport system substrate-binding protein
LIPELSEKKDEAWSYASYCVGSLEGIELYLEGGSGYWLPGWKRSWDLPVFTASDPYYGDQAWLTVFVEIAEDVPNIRLTLNDSIASSAVQEAVARILDEDEDPQAALDDANQQILDMLG